MRIWSYQGILEVAIFIFSYFMNSVSLYSLYSLYLFHILFYILRIVKYDSQSLLIVFLSDILESSWFDKVMWTPNSITYFTTMNQTENNCVLLVEGAVELDFMSSYRTTYWRQGCRDEVTKYWSEPWLIHLMCVHRLNIWLHAMKRRKYSDNYFCNTAEHLEFLINSTIFFQLVSNFKKILVKLCNV